MGYDWLNYNFSFATENCQTIARLVGYSKKYFSFCSRVRVGRRQQTVECNDNIIVLVVRTFLSLSLSVWWYVFILSLSPVSYSPLQSTEIYTALRPLHSTGVDIRSISDTIEGRVNGNITEFVSSSLPFSPISCWLRNKTAVSRRPGLVSEQQSVLD